MIEVSFMHRVDSFNYISFFDLCIFYILDLLGELLIEGLRATGSSRSTCWRPLI